MGALTMPKHFKLRTYQRVLMCGLGYYLSDEFLGKGTVWDLSVGGWRIEGDHHVRVGMVLTLRLELPDKHFSLEVEQAIVQWVNGRDFGVQIRKIRNISLKRLELLIGHQSCTHINPMIKYP